MTGILDRLLRRTLTLRTKTVLGFLAIVAMLVCTLTLSVLQLNSMDDYVMGLIQDDMGEIEITRVLSERVNAYNLKILSHIGDDEEANLPSFDQEFFVSGCDSLKQSLAGAHDSAHRRDRRLELKRTSDARKAEDARHSQLVDSVLYAYSAYMLITKEFKSVVLSDFTDTRDWYFNRLQPAFNRLINSFSALSRTAFEDLEKHSHTYNKWFGKSILLVVIAVVMSIILVLMLLYFYLSYFVTPVTKMARHVEEYRAGGKKYTYTFDGDDELASLNAALTELTSDNQLLRRRVKSLRATLSQKENSES